MLGATAAVTASAKSETKIRAPLTALETALIRLQMRPIPKLLSKWSIYI
jgi:hypothetical protein